MIWASRPNGSSYPAQLGFLLLLAVPLNTEASAGPSCTADAVLTAERAVELARAVPGPDVIGGLVPLLRTLPDCKALLDQCRAEVARRRPAPVAEADIVMIRIELTDGSTLHGELLPESDMLNLRVRPLEEGRWSTETRTLPARQARDKGIEKKSLFGAAALAVRSAQLKSALEAALPLNDPVSVVASLGRWHAVAPTECEKFVAGQREFNKTLEALASLCVTCRGTKRALCATCSGKGKIAGEQPCPQPRCQGKGTFGCKRCNETGRIECMNCGGDGVITRHYTERRGNRLEPRKRDAPCGTCNRSGLQRCVECNGKRSIRCQKCEGRGRVSADVACEPCAGEGRTACTDCGETGRRSN